MQCGRRCIQLGLFDTAGQEGFDRLRVLAYPGTDVFVVCFSVANPTSFTNVSEVWVPEIRHNVGEDAKIVLVGTKTDLRECSQTRKRLKALNQSPISAEQGHDLCKKLRLLTYLECSAFTQKGLKNVFELCAQEGSGIRPKKQEKHSFLRKFLCIGNKEL